MDEVGAVRIGDGERQASVDALIAHREAGRLDPTEFEERQVAAARARTWAEIAPLFRDLPAPYPVGMPSGLPAAPAPLPAAMPGPAGATGVERSGGLLDGIVPPRYRDTVMALTPLLAVLLFFVTKTWLWFLMIPILAIVLYGPDGKNQKKRNKLGR